MVTALATSYSLLVSLMAGVALGSKKETVSGGGVETVGENWNTPFDSLN